MIEPEVTKYLRERPDSFSSILERLLLDDGKDSAEAFGVLPKRSREYDGAGNPVTKKARRQEPPSGVHLFDVSDMRSEIENRIIASMKSAPERFLDLFMLALVSKGIRKEIQEKLARLEMEIDVVPQYCRAAFLYYKDTETFELFYEKIDRYAPATAAAWQLIFDSEELTEKFGALYDMKPAHFELALLNDAKDPLASLCCLHFLAGLNSPFTRADIKWFLERTWDLDLALFLQPRKEKQGLDWLKHVIIDKGGNTIPLGDDNNPVRWRLLNPVRYFTYCARYLALANGTETDLFELVRLPGRQFPHDGPAYPPNREFEEMARAMFRLSPDLQWRLLSHLDVTSDPWLVSADVIYYFLKYSMEGVEIGDMKELERAVNKKIHLVVPYLRSWEFYINIWSHVLLDLGWPLEAFDKMSNLLNEDTEGWHMDLRVAQYASRSKKDFFVDMVTEGRIDLLRRVVPLLLNRHPSLDDRARLLPCMRALLSRTFVEKWSRDGVLQLEIFKLLEPVWQWAGGPETVENILSNTGGGSDQYDRYKAFVGDPLAQYIFPMAANNPREQGLISIANLAFMVLTAPHEASVRERLQITDATTASPAFLDTLRTALWIALATPIPTRYASDILRVVHSFLETYPDTAEDLLVDTEYPFDQFAVMTSFGRFARLKLPHVIEPLMTLSRTWASIPRIDRVASPLVYHAQLVDAVMREAETFGEVAGFNKGELLLKWTLRDREPKIDTLFFIVNEIMRCRRIMKTLPACDNVAVRTLASSEKLWEDTKPDAMDETD